jgi:hypothetical protein
MQEEEAFIGERLDFGLFTAFVMAARIFLVLLLIPALLPFYSQDFAIVDKKDEELTDKERKISEAMGCIVRRLTLLIRTFCFYLEVLIDV